MTTAYEVSATRKPTGIAEKRQQLTLMTILMKKY